MSKKKNKTNLPELFNKTYDEMVSNFRLSLVFRISLKYIKVMFLNFIGFMIWFLIVFVLIESGYQFAKINNIIRETKKQVKINDEYFNIDNDLYIKLDELKIKGIGTRIINEETNEVFYDNLYINEINDYIYYNNSGNENLFIFNAKMNIKSHEGVNYITFVQYNFTEHASKLVVYVIILSLFFTIMLVKVHKRGKKGTKDVLSPIDEMAYTANRLNANNLSERINVAGIKNELKDLAIVINNMLDRIETSYDSQKQFVSDASHELRTPIAVIQGYANLLDRWGKADKEVMEEAIEAIKNESIEMQSLVEKLLFLARHDKKTLKLDKEDFNMKDLIEDMVRDTKLIAKDKEVILDNLESFYIYGDKQAIKQGIRVFIDNAVKYTPEGKTITLSCITENDYGIISIADKGIGMSKEDLNNIFNRFYRSDAVRNESISGHGLGLSIAKLIVLAHDGKIKVRSKLGEGSVFMLYFPTRVHTSV